MKAAIIAVVLICLVGLGLGAYLVLSKNAVGSTPSVPKTQESQNTTITGVLSPGGTAKDDYKHVITAGNKITGVSSYSVSLDQYVGKTVTVTGQFSGTTLYADTITEVK